MYLLKRFEVIARQHLPRLFIGVLAGFLLFVNSAELYAEPFKLGPKKCQECHKAEAKVWSGTKHAKSFKKVHKSKKAKKIVKAVGGKSMKKTALCASCHYTSVKKGKKFKLVAGPSCESCHGAAAEWISIHNKKAPKAEKIAAASAKGMIWPSQLFDVAANCNSCHGLTKENLTGDNIKAMLDAGHPMNADFELVKYSQGSVRHRFYPPKVTENQVMTPAEMARMFVIGQAANLVSASAAVSKSGHAGYKAAQQKKIAAATKVLKSVAGQVAAAGKVVASPTSDNGRALAAAIADKDLSGAVGGNLPKKFK
jgi:hypothetical protein